MQIVPLVVLTAFFVLGIIGTVGKLLFDDWQVRQITKSPTAAPEDSAASDVLLKLQE